MSREEIHKLIGGYATGTLTTEEREALFQAALEDQELFDTLAREQALHDLLSDPAAKAEVLAALDAKSPRWYDRLGWVRPAAAALAMAGLATVSVIWWRRPEPVKMTASLPQPMAEVRPSQPPFPPSPAPAPTEAIAGRPQKPAASAVDQLRASGGGGGGGNLRRKAEVDKVLRPEFAEARPGAVPPPPPPAAMPAPAAPPPSAPAGQPVPQPNLSGTVRDATGAGVKDATVTVAGNGPVNLEKKVRTDAQGNWSMDVQPGEYQLKVNAPGFKPGQSEVQLAAADVKRVDTRLDVGNVSETVQVTAGAAPLMQFRQQNEPAPLQQLAQAAQQAAASRDGAAQADAIGGRGGRGGAPSDARQLYERAAAQPQAGIGAVATRNAVMAQTAAAQQLAIRYSVLSNANGDRAQTSLQFTAAEDGFLTVTTPAGAALVSARLEKGKPFATAPLPAGTKQLMVNYTRLPAAAAKSALKDEANDLSARSAPPIQQTIAGVTYVAARTAQSGLAFTIDLP